MDQHCIPEQAGFRPGKSCTSQLFNLAQIIEDGYEKGSTTAAAFVYLYAAYYTDHHRILVQKLFQITNKNKNKKFILDPKITNNEPIDILGICIYTNKIDVHI